MNREPERRETGRASQPPVDSPPHHDLPATHAAPPYVPTDSDQEQVGGGLPARQACRCFGPPVPEAGDEEPDDHEAALAGSIPGLVIDADLGWSPWKSPAEGQIRALLEDALVREAAADLDRPHVVVIEDPLGNLLLEGPYDSALDALVAADVRRQEHAHEWPDNDYEAWIRVSPLVPPVRLH